MEIPARPVSRAARETDWDRDSADQAKEHRGGLTNWWCDRGRGGHCVPSGGRGWKSEHRAQGKRQGLLRSRCGSGPSWSAQKRRHFLARPVPRLGFWVLFQEAQPSSQLPLLPAILRAKCFG